MSLAAPRLRGQPKPGGIAAVLAHPDDESVGCAGALSLSYDAYFQTSLLVVTRGEAGTPDGNAGPGIRRRPRVGAHRRRQGDRDRPRLRASTTPTEPWPMRPSSSSSRRSPTGWTDVRPQAVITFGPHGVTGHPDHIVVGNATRWAVERLSDTGQAPNSVFVISPIFDPGGNLYDLSPEEQAATHRIDITAVAPASWPRWSATPARPIWPVSSLRLRAAIESGEPIYEGYQRVRPLVPSPHPEYDTRLL